MQIQLIQSYSNWEKLKQKKKKGYVSVWRMCTPYKVPPISPTVLPPSLLSLGTVKLTSQGHCPDSPTLWLAVGSSPWESSAGEKGRVMPVFISL